MTDIGETGSRLQTALNPRDPNGSVHLLQVAALRFGQELGIVTSATQGSTAPEAASLNEQMQAISAALGEVAGRLSVAIDDRNALLRRWGLDSSTLPPPSGNGSQPNTSQSIEAAPQESKSGLSPAALGVVLVREIPSDHKTFGPTKRSSLRSRGIHTVRDVLVSGTNYLGRTQDVGVSTADYIKTTVTELTDGLVVKEKPTIEDIAKLCPDLSEVSIAALHDNGLTMGGAFGLNKHPMSVQNLLEIPRDVMLRRIPSYFDAYQRQMAIRQYDALIGKAKAFAAAFNEIKQQAK